MANTKLFKNGNSQAVRIPAELAYSTWDVDLVIERQGDDCQLLGGTAGLGLTLGCCLGCGGCKSGWRGNSEGNQPR